MFRQYLAQITKDKEITSIVKETAIANLPVAMLCLVGLQSEHINIGTCNPFMLAAKIYFAMQHGNSLQKDNKLNINKRFLEERS
jgi:hypothetical protein